MNNRDGPPVLVADWIGSMAARWLGVPVPECTIVELGDVVDVPLGSEGADPAQPGPCFGSKFMPAFGWEGDSQVLCAVENIEAIAGVVVADTWLRNVDRYCLNRDGTERFNNPGNILLQPEQAARGRFRLIAIDFGYAFGGPAWNARELTRIDTIRDDTIYGFFPVFGLYMQRTYLSPFLTRLSGLTDEVARSFVTDLPGRWRLGRADVRSIVEFLKRRGEYVADKLNKMVSEGDDLWETSD